MLRPDEEDTKIVYGGRPRKEGDREVSVVNTRTGRR